VLASCVAVVVIAYIGQVFGWHVQGGPDTPDITEGPVVPKEVTVRVGDEAIDFGIVMSFPDQVTLTGPTLRVGRTTGAARLWPLDDRDHEGQDLDPLTLRAGMPVALEGYARPPCAPGEPGPEVVFAVTVESLDGSTQRHHFPALHPEVVPPAVEEWCSGGPSVTAGMEYLGPNGEAVIGVTVINPGPEVIDVEVPAYADQHVSWTEASSTVPPGQQVSLKIHGTDVGCERGEIASWEGGRLLIEGKPFVVTSDDAWC
jgi:hypothetical protein